MAHPSHQPAPPYTSSAVSGAPAPAPGWQQQQQQPPNTWDVPRHASGTALPPGYPGGAQQPPQYHAPRPPPPAIGQLAGKEEAWRQAAAAAAAANNYGSSRYTAPPPLTSTAHASAPAAPAPASAAPGHARGGSSEQRPPKTIKVYGDGHCLYRSVACHLNPDIARLPRNEFGIILRPDERPIEEAAAISLRNRVASYMESHWDEFPTVLVEERATRLRGIRGR
jgi:hypothetical protein